MAVCSIFVFLLTICLATNCVRTNAIEEPTSYVEGLNFKYENGKWICGDVQCPGETTGCRIRIRSDEKDQKIIYQSFNCVDSLGAADILELAEEKSVDININTYAGAKSGFSLSYNNIGKEVAKGTVAPDELEELKENFKVLKANVMKTKAAAVFTKGVHPLLLKSL